MMMMMMIRRWVMCELHHSPYAQSNGRYFIHLQSKETTKSLHWFYILVIAWKENSAKTLTNKDLSPLAVWLRAAEH